MLYNEYGHPTLSKENKILSEMDAIDAFERLTRENIEKEAAESHLNKQVNNEDYDDAEQQLSIDDQKSIETRKKGLENRIMELDSLLQDEFEVIDKEFIEGLHRFEEVYKDAKELLNMIQGNIEEQSSQFSILKVQNTNFSCGS